MAGQGRDVGGNELTWTVATDILHWYVFAWRSCECAASTDLFFGVVTSGDRSGGRASVPGRAALKNHWRLTEPHWEWELEWEWEWELGF